MKVYVIYDPLHEKILCVHEEHNMECDACKHIGDNNGYGIYEQEFEVAPSKQKQRQNKLNQLI